MDFETPDEKKLSVKPIIGIAKQIIPLVCPNPNISISLPNKSITFGCK